MSNTQRMMKRSEVDPADCWDLSRIFADEAAARKELARLEDAVNTYLTRYPSRAISATEPKDLLRQTAERLQLTGRLHDLNIYASLLYSQDMSDPAGRNLERDVASFLNRVQALFSDYESELAELPEERLSQVAKDAEDFGFERIFTEIRRHRAHRLSRESERVLAAFGGAFDLPYTAYETAKAADLVFPNLRLAEREVPLSYVLYENDYSVSSDTELRRKSFASFSRTLGEQRNTIAALYNAQIQKEKVEAKLRGFDSVIDYLLHRQNVSRELYDRQIDGITRSFASTMRRYAEVLRRELRLDKMTFADLKAPLDPELDPQISKEEASHMIREALAVMGEDYQKSVMRFRDERWVDFAQNIGKSTGGFCTATTAGHPFILLSWTNRISEAFTLAHELGHAAQDIYGMKDNHRIQSSPGMYLVEAPSTMHELLLARRMLSKHENNPRLKRFVLDTMLSNTYYHNFVTHLLEADYQREVYRLVDQGRNLGADDFDRLTRESLERFWGDAVEITEGAERTWMRQPHYYMGLYSYTYSAGLTLATGFYRRLLAGDRNAVEDWIRFLRAGGSKSPLELAAIAGFDLTTSELFDETLAFLDELVTQIEELSR